MHKLFKNDIFFDSLIIYLFRSWKVILIASVLGLSCGLVFLELTPRQYEAIAQIKMASIASSDLEKPDIVVEDPNLLLIRLNLPSTYSSKELKACGFHGLDDRPENIVAITKAVIVKGVPNVIQLKAQARSESLAISCVEAIFENIKSSQKNIVSPLLNEAKILRSQYKSQLNELELNIKRANKSDASSTTVFLISDQMKFLNREIFRLDTFIISAGNRYAKLISPVYSSGVAIFPNKKAALIGGSLLGVILGCLLIFCREAWNIYKNHK